MPNSLLLFLESGTLSSFGQLVTLNDYRGFMLSRQANTIHFLNKRDDDVSTIRFRFAVHTVCITNGETIWKPCKNWGSHSGIQKRFKSSVMLQRIDWKTVADVSGVHIPSIVRISSPWRSIMSVPIYQSIWVTCRVTEGLIWTPVQNDQISQEFKLRSNRTDL